MSGTSAVHESTLKMKNVKCWKMQGRGCVNVLEHYERITKLIRHLEVLSTIILCHCLSFQYNLLKISVEYINQMLRSTFKTSRRKPFSVLTLEVFFYQLQGGRMVTCLPSAIVTTLCHLHSPLFHSERLYTCMIWPSKIYLLFVSVWQSHLIQSCMGVFGELPKGHAFISPVWSLWSESHYTKSSINKIWNQN